MCNVCLFSRSFFSNKVYKTKTILKGDRFFLQGRRWKSAEVEAIQCCAPSSTLNTFWKPKSCEFDLPLLSVCLSWTLQGNWHLLKLRTKSETECSSYWPPHIQIYMRNACLDCWNDTWKPGSVSLTFRISLYFLWANKTQICSISSLPNY